jgi:hypothetical protein
VLADASASVRVELGHELAALAIGEVLAEVALRLGASAGLVGAGQASTAITFGVGLVAGLAAERAIAWAFGDPRDYLARRLGAALDELKRRVLDGTPGVPGLRAGLERATAGRIARRSGRHRGDLAGKAAREVAERLGRGLSGAASSRAAHHIDDVARVAARHTLAATPLRALSRAMPRLTPRNTRRLTMLAEDGTLARSGRWGELVAVIERHGDRAMDFIWRNKGALAVATVLGTFLADPEAILGGGRELIGGAAQEATQPIALMAGTAASRWMNIARSVVVVGLAWLVLVPALMVSARLIRQIRRRSHC